MAAPSRSIPHIFVSHSHKDHEFGIRLIQDLRRRLGDEDAVWYDKSGGLRGGDFWWKKIQKELKARNVFIVLLSPSANRSRWVKEEIDIALHYGVTKKMLIIPVIYRPCTIPDELKRIHILSYPPLNDYHAVLGELLETLEGHFNKSFKMDSITRVSNPDATEAATIQQILPRIERAFNKEAWSYVIGEVSTLSNQYPGAISSCLYCMQGLAYLFTGRTHHAQQTFAKALTLQSPPEQRLTLLDAYTGIFIGQHQWEKVLFHANEALELTPKDSTWQIVREEALKRIGSNKLAVIVNSQNGTNSINGANKIEIEAKKAEIRQDATAIRSAPKEREQNHQIELHHAELEMKRMLLEIERQEVELQKARLEFEEERVTFALGIGDLLVEKLYPVSDVKAKVMLTRTFLQNLLQFGTSKAVELALPAQHGIQEENKTEDN